MISLRKLLPEAKEHVFIDDDDTYKSTITYKEQGEKGAGAIFPKTWRGDGSLIELDSFDKKVIKGVKLKADERIFRYVTDATNITKMSPLIKINYKKGLVYFLTQDSAENGGFVAFETRGVPVHFMRVRAKKL